MASSAFYVTLPSNASADVFKDNSASQFRTDLARPIDLKGDWEVALTDFCYPNTWLTIPPEGDRFYWQDTWQFGVPEQPDVPLPADEDKYKVHHERLGYGSYSRESILNQLNIHLKRIRSDIRLSYDGYRRIYTWTGSGRYKVKFSAPLNYILGMERDRWFSTGPGTVPSPRPADLKAGFYHLYLYSDVVSHQFVGDTFAPLLRCVTTEGAYGDFITKSFNPPHYLQLAKNHIDTIYVEIKSDQNSPVNFRYGKTILTLHFRPCEKK